MAAATCLSLQSRHGISGEDVEASFKRIEISRVRISLEGQCRRDASNSFREEDWRKRALTLTFLGSIGNSRLLTHAQGLVNSLSHRPAESVDFNPEGCDQGFRIDFGSFGAGASPAAVTAQRYRTEPNFSKEGSVRSARLRRLRKEKYCFFPDLSGVQGCPNHTVL